MKRHHSQAGNTIISVLIALGLASIVIFTLATVFSDAFKNQRSITQSVAAEQEAALLLVALSRPETCTQALLKDAAGNLISTRTPTAVKVGIPYTEIRIPQISGGSVVLSRVYTSADCKVAENAAACNNVVLSAMSLGPKKNAAGVVIDQIIPEFMLAEMSLTFKKTGAVAGPSSVTRTVPIGLNIDAATGRITGCQSAGGDINISAGDSKPQRRCAPAVYADRPWMKERIYCQNPGGEVAVLNYAGDGLYGATGAVIYTSPHGDAPLNIWYDSKTGSFIKYGGGTSQDGGNCINNNLKFIADDKNNTCS